MKLGQKIICASFGESYYSVLKEQLLKMHSFIAVYPSGQMTQNGLLSRMFGFDISKRC